MTVTQVMQENVVETERGIVNGMQNSLNMLLEMIKCVLVIILPHVETYGILILMSFIFIFTAGILFSFYAYRKSRSHQDIQSSSLDSTFM